MTGEECVCVNERARGDHSLDYAEVMTRLLSEAAMHHTLHSLGSEFEFFSCYVLKNT